MTRVVCGGPLDALVRRNATGFDVSVPRNSTFSGLGISFFGYCAHKFIKSLLSRANGIFSKKMHIDLSSLFSKYFNDI